MRTSLAEQLWGRYPLRGRSSEDEVDDHQDPKDSRSPSANGYTNSDDGIAAPSGSGLRMCIRGAWYSDTSRLWGCVAEVRGSTWAADWNGRTPVALATSMYSDRSQSRPSDDCWRGGGGGLTF